MSIDKKLTSIVDRIERLEEEQKGIGSDKRDIFSEAKSAGYNPKALRRLIAARKRKDEAEVEADLELYRAALGMPGATYRSVAEQTGVSKTKLQRLVPKKTNGTEPAVEPDHSGAAEEARSSNDGPGASAATDIDTALPAFLDRRPKQDAEASVSPERLREAVT